MKTCCFRFRIMLLSFCIAFTCGGQTATAASVPVMIKDIKTRIKDNSNIHNLVAAGSTLLFTAYDQANGNELWKSVGTGATTVMVKDIKPGTMSSYHNPNYITYWNGFSYFEADGPNGWSLWKSDGTTANTVEVSQDVDPENFVIFKGVLYFSGYSDGLWKTDGTTAGTVAVSSGIGTLDNLVVAGANKLYFTNNNDLWVSDGTTAGTVLLQSDIWPTELTSVNGTLYFQGWDSVNDYRLWTSDGTAAGTVALPYAADPANLTDVNGTLYFTANDPIAGSSLVKLVPGGAPTVVKSGISPINLFNLNGVLYFSAGGDLWTSNGTLAGTVVVMLDIWPDRFANVNGTLYFKGWDNAHGYELWKSNGTAAGTVMVKDIFLKDIITGENDSNPDQLTNVNGTLFFTAKDPTNGTQLWKSDGSTTGTILVKIVSLGTQDASPNKLFNLDGTLYFAADDYDNGNKLWQSNGTAAGTSMVAGLTGANPVPLANVNGTLFFAANSDDLWKRVGTSPAVLVKAGVTTNDPNMVSAINGTLYFRGWDSAHGWELWKSDGTAAGTVMVKDIKTGVNSSDVRNLVSLGNTLYFIANADTTNNGQLWKSDGTDAGTVRVSTAIKNAENLTLVNGKLFFSGNDTSNTNALWVSDGSTITVLKNSLYPTELTAVGTALFFEGWTSPLGYELWKSDGTTAGTVLVKDINPSGGSSNPENLTNVNGTLYFSVKDGSAGATEHDQLWKSDGTTAGTVMVKDLPADYTYTSINSLTSVHGSLAFTYMDKSYQPTTDDSAELWISDGTAAGTVKVAEIFPGDFGSAPATLTMANTPPNGIDKEALFFSAIDPLVGREIFILDFTPPVSAINSPLNNNNLRGTSFIISGTASDSMPGTGVTRVEVSTDNGVTWHNATGSGTWASWQYTWANPLDGVYTIKSRATDLATNVQTPLASITVTVDNTRPVVSFVLPAVYHGPLATPLPITTFNVTEVNPNVYCLTKTNSSAGCVWTATKPTTILVASEGNHTYFAWAQDKAGNISTAGSDTVLVALPHTLNINFTNVADGSGSVVFVQRSQAYSTNYSTTVYSFDPVTLQQTPAEYSVFGGWSGICANSSGNCQYTVPTAAGGTLHSATATFTFDTPHAVLVDPNNIYYPSIMGAYNAVATGNGDVLGIWGVNFNEALLFDLDKQITLRGGENGDHSSATGMTTVTLPGKMAIRKGTVRVKNLSIR